MQLSLLGACVALASNCGFALPSKSASVDHGPPPARHFIGVDHTSTAFTTGILGSYWDRTITNGIFQAAHNAAQHVTEHAAPRSQPCTGCCDVPDHVMEKAFTAGASCWNAVADGLCHLNNRVKGLCCRSCSGTARAGSTASSTWLPRVTSAPKGIAAHACVVFAHISC